MDVASVKDMAAEPKSKAKSADSDADAALEADKRATELLIEKRPGDDHYPGEVNTERVSINKDLPRRT